MDLKMIALRKTSQEKRIQTVWFIYIKFSKMQLNLEWQKAFSGCLETGKDGHTEQEYWTAQQEETWGDRDVHHRDCGDGSKG